MDPTIEALTIHPAAWAALFQRLAETIAYSMAVVATILVAIVALFGWLGNRPDAEEAPAAPTIGSTPRGPVDAPRGPVDAPRGLGVIGPVLLIQRQTHAARRRPRTGCRRVA